MKHIMKQNRSKLQNNHYILFLLLLILIPSIFLTTCDLLQPEEEEREDPYIEVQTYLDNFVEEAALRGYDFKAQVDSLEIVFQDSIVYDNKEYCGYVPLTTEGWYGKTVLFASNSPCWWNENKADREALVFHELGHAILERTHNDARLSNGAWQSIMASSFTTSSLYGGKIADRRTYYMDELFDPSTPEPDWIE